MANKRKKSTSVPLSTPSSPSPSPSPAPADLFIVDQILPKFEVHLMGGPSKAGKTTLLFQLIDRWRKRRDIFGHEPFPAPFCYLACERSTGYIRSTLKRIGIDPSTFPFVSAVEHNDIINFESAYSLACQEVPDLQVLFIDGIHCLCGKSNDDQTVSALLKGITQKLEDLNLTVIGVGNSTKIKGEDRFNNPCERFRGSSVWSTGSSTMIVVERARGDELRNPKRVVMVIPSNAPDQVLNYSVDAKGLFQPDVEEPSRFEEFVEMVVCRDPGDELTRTELLEIASYVGDQGVPERSVNNYIKRLVDEGRLERADWGRYRLPLKH